jgi:hypothetical protein
MKDEEQYEPWQNDCARDARRLTDGWARGITRPG